MTLTFHPGDLDSPDVVDLLELHFTEMRASSPRDACHVLTGDALRSPSITCWSVRNSGALVGICALKELGDAHGEIKSMRTVPAALGRGVGTRMLAHIVGEARARGYRRLSLETGSSVEFAAALHLYQREGFTPCEAFGGYPTSPFTRFLTLEL